ncbi:MAG: YraN family protein [Candidatus Falkowbacteria bacterium]
MTLHNKQFGQWGEDMATEFYAKQGYSVIERNYRRRFGEIDLICAKGNEIVFIEVKTRSTNFLPGERAVNYEKRDTIKRLIKYYIQAKNIGRDVDCRFDILVVEKEGDKVNFRQQENVIL